MRTILAVVAIMVGLAGAASPAPRDDSVPGIPNTFPPQKTPLIGVFLQPAAARVSGPDASPLAGGQKDR